MSTSARCVICDHEVSNVDDLPEGTAGCPKCGTTSIPCDPADDVTVRINWHELRILSIWSEFWANAHPEAVPDMKQPVFSITRRLEAQHPDKPPLTLGGEIRQLKQTFPGIETNIPHEEGFDPTNQ